MFPISSLVDVLDPVGVPAVVYPVLAQISNFVTTNLVADGVLNHIYGA